MANRPTIAYKGGKRFEDTSPSVFDNPLEKILKTGKRGSNWLADLLLGSTPEEEMQTMMESFISPMATGPGVGRRAISKVAAPTRRRLLSPPQEITSYPVHTLEPLEGFPARIMEDFSNLEDAWIGGLGDFGDPIAGVYVRNHPHYDKYLRLVQDQARERLGDKIKVFRSVSRNRLDNWADEVNPIGVTTNERLARNWKNLSAKRTGKDAGERVVVEFNITPDDIVMRGHDQEAELVIDPTNVSAHMLRILK